MTRDVIDQRKQVWKSQHLSSTAGAGHLGVSIARLSWVDTMFRPLYTTQEVSGIVTDSLTDEASQFSSIFLQLLPPL